MKEIYDKSDKATKHVHLVIYCDEVGCYNKKVKKVGHVLLGLLNLPKGVAKNMNHIISVINSFFLFFFFLAENNIYKKVGLFENGVNRKTLFDKAKWTEELEDMAKNGFVVLINHKYERITASLVLLNSDLPEKSIFFLFQLLCKTAILLRLKLCGHLSYNCHLPCLYCKVCVNKDSPHGLAEIKIGIMYAEFEQYEIWSKSAKDRNKNCLAEEGTFLYVIGISPQKVAIPEVMHQEWLRNFKQHLSLLLGDRTTGLFSFSIFFF